MADKKVFNNLDFQGVLTAKNLRAAAANGEAVRYNEFNAHTSATNNPHSVSLEQARSQDNQLSGNIDFNSNTGINVPNPTNDGDLTNKAWVLGQIDVAKNEYDVKDPVVVVATSNVAIATGLANGQTIDGVTLSTGDRIALVAQTDGTENGIYVAPASGAASRAADADADAEVTTGLKFAVLQGTKAGAEYLLTTKGAITVGTTSLTFTQLHVPTSITAGAGLTKAGSTINAVGGNGITANADSLEVDASTSFFEFVSGELALKENGVTGTEIAADTLDSDHYKDGSIDNIHLANSSLTVTAGNGLGSGGSVALGASVSLTVAADTTGGANLATAINVSANGVAIKIDDSSVGVNGSDQLYIKNDGVTGAMLHADIFGDGLDFASDVASLDVSYLFYKDTFNNTTDWTTVGSDAIHTVAAATHGFGSNVAIVKITQDDGTNLVDVTGDVVNYIVKASNDAKIEILDSLKFSGEMILARVA